MTGTQLLDAVEQTLLDSRSDKVNGPERDILLSWLNTGIAEIISLGDWDWAVVSGRPVCALTQGKRTALLPSNFGENFVRYAYLDGTKWACKLADPVNLTEQFMYYLSPVQYFSRSLQSTTLGTPLYYTIETVADGRRQINVDMPPDSTYATWVINGLYIPTDWLLEEEGMLPPLPGNSPILLHYLLKRIFATPEFKDPQLLQFHMSEYDKATAIMITAANRNRQGQFVPGNQIINNYNQLESGGMI